MAAIDTVQSKTMALRDKLESLEEELDDLLERPQGDLTARELQRLRSIENALESTEKEMTRLHMQFLQLAELANPELRRSRR